MKHLISLIFVVIVVSCTVDYNPDVISANTQNQLIVNSYLSPQNKIVIQFYSTVYQNKVYAYKGEKNVTVVLKENDSILYSGICADSILALDYYPKVGRNYSITSFAGGLSPVSAETRVPEPVGCEAKLAYDNTIVNLNKFRQTKEMNSIWITANYLKVDTVYDPFIEYITNSSLADNVNKSNEINNVNKILGASYCDGFIRIKAANLQQLDSLMFCDYRPLLTSSSRKYNGVRVNLITASNEYDQYNRTYYQQMSTPAENDMNAMVYQPVHVYSNIKNGLGIFAGLNETYYLIYK